MITRPWRRSALVLFALCLVLTAGAPASFAAAQASDRLVLAFYYAWYDWSTWTLGLSDQPLNPYVSSSATTIARHVQEAQRAGIDALVQAWYGPTTNNNQTEPNFWLLLGQAEVYGSRAAVSVDLGGPFLQTAHEVQEALLALRDRHGRHRAYLAVDGRPVVFFWRQTNFPVSTWEAIRNQVDPQRQMIWIAEGTRTDYLTVFDGLYLYSVAWSDQPATVLQRWGNEVRGWSALNNASRLWVATVMPGYNDLVTGRPDAFVRQRNDGAYYRDCWQGAGASLADWIVITSFNEWMEGTQIEPSVTYGDFYLGLTGQLAADYRAGRIDPTPTLAPVTPTETAETPLEPTPVMTETAEIELPVNGEDDLSLDATPTALQSPTATPIRLATPTPVSIVAVPTTATPGAISTAAPEEAAPLASPTRPALMPVEGGGPTRACPPWPLAIPLVLWLGRRRLVWPER